MTSKGYRVLNDVGLWELASPYLRTLPSASRLQEWMGSSHDTQAETFNEVVVEVLLDSFEGVWIREQSGLEQLLLQFQPLQDLDLSFARMHKGFLRDHLRHLVRDMLFALALQDLVAELDRPNYHLINIVALLHDIAYPVEKFEKNLRKYSDKLGDHYFGSKFKTNLRLAKPHVIARLLHSLGSHSDNTDAAEYYSNVVIPAVVENGLFRTKHNYSGSVLLWAFIPPSMSDPLDPAFGRILSVADAIALHDRAAMPWKPLTKLASIFRLADELQEWERGGPVDFSEPILLERPADGTLKMEYKLRRAEGGDGEEPDLLELLPSKILGLWPLGECLNSLQLKFRVYGPADIPFNGRLLRKRILEDRVKDAVQLGQHVSFSEQGYVTSRLGGRLRHMEDDWLMDVLRRQVRVVGELKVGTVPDSVTVDLNVNYRGTPRFHVEVSS